jgi:hypothetical protein
MRSIRLRDDDGNILVTTVLVSLLIGAMASLTLATGEQADRSSARDRNHEIALGVVEAGINETIERVEDLATAGGYYLPRPQVASFNGQTEQGTWETTVTRVPDEDGIVDDGLLDDGFVIDAVGKAGVGGTLERARHVRVKMLPPEIFPAGKYALFSKTSITLKNGDEVLDGDIWADNGGVTVQTGATLDGSITSAQSWVHLENGSNVTKFVQTGGRFCNTFTAGQCTNGWALRHDGSTIGGAAKLGVTGACPIADPEKSQYKAIGSGTITGTLTQPSSATYPGKTPVVECTTAPAPLTLKPFVFNPSFYPPGTVWQGTPAEFNALPDGEHKGVFYVPAVAGTPATQLARLNLDGWVVTGDLLIVTDYPVWADQVTEDPGLEQAMFIVVSHYAQWDPSVPMSNPNVAGCDFNNDNSDCAIHAKNHFSFDDGRCITAVLLYADNGSVALKNQSNSPGEPDVCGAIMSAGIDIKNNLNLMYDPRIERVLGFGPRTLELAEWVELPVE